MRIKAVISRYAKSVIGGGEKHARDVLGLLALDHEVHVYTTCATDYTTWKNDLPVGESVEDKIRIHRFRTEQKRDMVQFNSLTQLLHSQYPYQSPESENLWLEMQGPFCPDLVDHLSLEHEEDDLYFLFSYLYYPVVKIAEKFPKNCILIPMLHDEFPAYLRIYKTALTQDIGYAFNAPEELETFERILGFRPKLRSVIGTFVDIPCESEEVNEIGKTLIANMIGRKNENKIHYPIDTSVNYVFTIGRMDLGKGFAELIEFFLEWVEKSEQKCELWIAGKNPEKIKKKYRSPYLRFLGYVSEEVKWECMRRAKLFINPSSLESFSLVLMEAWAAQTPALVNGRSNVLKGHCLRSNGGLYYSDRESFQITLDRILDDREFALKLGQNGFHYVKRNFERSRVLQKLTKFIAEKGIQMQSD